jgi:hypothetical protein
LGWQPHSGIISTMTEILHPERHPEGGNRYLWEILVPKQTNTGEEIPVEFHHVWDESVREISGGLTILKTAKGHWVNPDGELFVEPMIPVRIVCSKKQMKQIVDLTAAHYEQEAIMFYRISKKVKIKHFPTQ